MTATTRHGDCRPETCGGTHYDPCAPLAEKRDGSRHAVKTDIDWAGSGRDGDPWVMVSWDVKWCDCDRPWRHEALA